VLWIALSGYNAPQFISHNLIKCFDIVHKQYMSFLVKFPSFFNYVLLLIYSLLKPVPSQVEKGGWGEVNLKKNLGLS
jgi:hypothetical protein